MSEARRPKCRHLQASYEAYQIDDRDNETAIVVWLCLWPTNNPALEMAPAWLRSRADSGGPVHPDRDCVGCDGWQKVIPANEPPHA